MNRLIVAAALALCSTMAVADEFIITRPGGASLVYEGDILDESESDDGGTVWFVSSETPTPFTSDRLMNSGFEPSAWNWRILNGQAFADGSGNCAITADLHTVILDCADDVAP
jgi:hypothetical protein